MAVRTLRDGTRVVLRPIEPDDKEALLEGFARLSDESRYRRFFTPMPRLTQAQLRYLTEVDHDRHEAVIAFEEETGEPIGVARYVRLDHDASVAEPAVTVVDHWQGRGLGTLLLDDISERAHAAGVERFAATVLAANDPMISLFEHLDTDAHETIRDGVLSIQADLPAAGTAPSFRDALRAAATDRLALLKGMLDLGRGR